MRAELEINGKNAYATWGVRLADGSLSALMTPPPMKDYILNESASVNGKILANAPIAMPKVDSRDVQVTLHITASNMAQFYARYNAFVTELQSGVINLKTRYQEGVTYRLLYQSCSQFSNFNGRLGKFVLRLTEPDPTNRSDND